MKLFCILISVLFAIPAYSQFASFEGPATWDGYETLPEYENWSWMYAEAEDIAQDLNSNSGAYELEYKSSGGSSHQTLIKRRSDGRTMGIWSPPNHATFILGEIFPFHLARLLKRSNWVPPGTRMTLTGPGRDKAYEALKTTNISKARLCNRDNVISYMNHNPYYITGVYEAFTPGEKIVNVPEMGEPELARGLNPNHFLVRMVYADGPRPTGRPVYLLRKGNAGTLSYEKNGEVLGESTDLELAKQLSFMLLVDALNSQRDRFDGSNMDVILREDGSFVLSPVDSGGILDEVNTVSLKFFLGTNNKGRGVSRFEKEIMTKIIALDDFIHGRTASFEGFTSVEELKRAMGYENIGGYNLNFEMPASCRYNYSYLFYSIESRWKVRWRNFVAALEQVAQHLRGLENNPNAYF